MMYAIQLDMYQAAAVAALVLLLGRFLVRNLDLDVYKRQPQSRLGHVKGLGGGRKAARFCYL